MYSVSDAYKIDMQNVVRGESTIEVAHILPNYHNIGGGSPTNFPDGMLDNTPNEYFNIQVQSANFEPCGCILDGSYYLRSETAINLGGEYVSNVLSNSAGVVGTNDYTILLYGVTALNVPKSIYLMFDSKEIVKPESITITMKTAGGVTIGTPLTYTDTDFNGYRAQLALPTITGSETTLGQIVITVASLNMPYSFIRFEKVILGTVNEFGDDIITDAEWKVTGNPLTFEIPSADFTFTFLDPENLYHESNPDSKFGEIVENQQVGFRFGLTPQGAGTEWVNGGLYRTTGEKSVSQGLIPQVTVHCRHASVIADELVRELDSTLVSVDSGTEVPVALQNLIDLMDIIGVEATISSYNGGVNIVETATVVDTNISLKEYCQIMANAHGMTWFIDRTDSVKEKIILREFPNLQMSSDDEYDTPTLNLYNQVEDLVDYYTGIYLTGQDQNQAFSNLFGTSYLFQFNDTNLFELPMIKSVPVSDGINYANYNHITNATDRGTYPAVPNGTRLIKVDNPFVTTKFTELQTGVVSNNIEPNKRYGEYISDYYAEYKTYVLVNRGFPELDMGDIVHVWMPYYKTSMEVPEYILNKRAVVVGNKITYNGAIKGETTVVEWEEVLDKNYGV